MAVVNLTPHSVVLVDENRLTVTVPASGQVLRAEEERNYIGQAWIGGGFLPVYRLKYGRATGVDPAQWPAGTVVLVSRLAAEAVRGRSEWAHLLVIIPNDVIRDEHGLVTGCRSLSRV